MFDYTKTIAVSLKLDIDYDIMSAELLRAQKNHKCISFSYPIHNNNIIEEATAYSLFLRKSTEPTPYSYRGAKSADISSYDWDNELDITYTKSIISLLPYDTLGAVRVVYFPGIPCIEHTDWDDPKDYEHTLGLSIIPSTANVDCNIWSEIEKKWMPVPGNAMLLNDSIKHAVPKGTGTRIAVRIFGKIDYSWFNDKIINIFY